MPLKISIAVSRKKGERNYGSRGATVGLEMDADGSLVDQPQQLQERLAKLFGLAETAVDRQLEGPMTCRSECTDEGAKHSAPRNATRAQIRAIYAIGDRRQLDLTPELQSRFGVDRPMDLTLAQASQFIDIIKRSSNGIPDDDSIAGPS